MHMADALLSPAVGATMWAGSVAAIGYSSKKLKENIDNKTIPLMGVMGAFVFAAQMINFTIPVTGSSGHIGGGMLLAVLLGPYAAFLAMASILTVQALFFADGGLLALGCNIWNMGIYPCFLVYPLIYKPVAGDGKSARRVSVAAILGAIVALQLGAFRWFWKRYSPESANSLRHVCPADAADSSGHRPGGGIITAGIILYVQQARPEILHAHAAARPLDAGLSIKNILAAFVILAVITGGALSWFASTHPDGLEWSIEKVTGKGELEEGNTGHCACPQRYSGKDGISPRLWYQTARGRTKHGGVALGLAGH